MPPVCERGRGSRGRRPCLVEPARAGREAALPRRRCATPRVLPLRTDADTWRAQPVPASVDGAGDARERQHPRRRRGHGDVHDQIPSPGVHAWISPRTASQGRDARLRPRLVRSSASARGIDDPSSGAPKVTKTIVDRSDDRERTANSSSPGRGISLVACHGLPGRASPGEPEPAATTLARSFPRPRPGRKTTRPARSAPRAQSRRRRRRPAAAGGRAPRIRGRREPSSGRVELPARSNDGWGGTVAAHGLWWRWGRGGGCRRGCEGAWWARAPGRLVPAWRSARVPRGPPPARAPASCAGPASGALARRGPQIRQRGHWTELHGSRSGLVRGRGADASSWRAGAQPGSSRA